MTSEAAYYFTQMESAVMFIQEADYKNLSISEEEFRQNVERAEELIQSGLDIHHYLPRTRPSRSRVSSLLLVTPPPSPSPMMSRRTTVIEEWSQLQRTRSLSQSKSDRGEKATMSTSKSAPVNLQHTEQPPPRPSLSFSSSSESETVVSPKIGDQVDFGASSGEATPKLTSPVIDDSLVVPKFLATSFEELTVSELKKLHSCYLSLVQKCNSGH